MIDRFCRRCRETVTRDQIECPFCGQETVPLDAIAAGTQSAEITEDLAPSEGCQSGGKAASPETPHGMH